MGNAFLEVAKSSETMIRIIETRIKAMEQMKVHLNNIHVYTLAIGTLGLSDSMKQAQRQKDTMIAEIVALHDIIYRLSLIHEIETNEGIKVAKAFANLHAQIESKGFPKNRDEARNL